MFINAVVLVVTLLSNDIAVDTIVSVLGIIDRLIYPIALINLCGRPAKALGVYAFMIVVDLG